MFDSNSTKKKSPKRIFALVLVVLMVLSFLGGLYLGLQQGINFNKPLSLTELISELKGQNKEIDFGLIEKVWQRVTSKYVDQPVDERKLFYGALTGLVASLGDPYSNFLDPELSKLFKDEIVGSFEGIGAEIGIKNDKLTVIAPLPNSPAEKAGLKAKDQIWEIDSLETSGMSLDYATSLIRGKKGTKVKLLILHEEAKEAEEIEITRDKIKIQSVTWEIKKAGENKTINLGYLKISSFTEDIEKSLLKAINSFTGSGVKGIILDLRNNSGGYLETAISVASEFISEGTIVIEEFSDKTKKTYEAQGGASLTDYPVVVLINEGSASASEIVAGALRDHEKATLVGETSFGKGSVQEYEELSDGSSLKITTAKWLTPKGNSIGQEGIEPDVMVELKIDDFNNNRDPQLDKAIEILIQELI